MKTIMRNRRLPAAILLTVLLFLTGRDKTYAQSPQPLSECTCSCLNGLFDYLIRNKLLFIQEEDNVLVKDLVLNARRAGFEVSITECPLLAKNLSKTFYALTQNSVDTVYRARIGDCSISIKSQSAEPIDFYQLAQGVCAGFGIDYTGKLEWQKFYATRVSTINNWFSLYLYKFLPPDYGYLTYNVESQRICAYSQRYNDYDSPIPEEWYESNWVRTIFAFDGFNNEDQGGGVVSANVKLFAAEDGKYIHPFFEPAHNTPDNLSMYLYRDSWDTTWVSDTSSFFGRIEVQPQINIEAPDKDLVADVKNSIQQWRNAPQTTQPPLSFFLIEKFQRPGRNYATFYSHLHPDSTKWPYLEVLYNRSYGGSNPHAILQIDSCMTCEPVASGFCYSALTDTSVNPYLYGLAGNWRPQTSYTYYSSRRESDPSLATNTRKDGTIKDFAAFWKLVSGTWEPQHDESRWSWTTASTLFNRKGLELENKDPLGRYNAGLYGYDEALAKAVVQNSRYREALYEGFEDYYFGAVFCDTACPPGRLFDKTAIDSTQQHTGLYSLRVAAGASIGITADVVDASGEAFELTFHDKNVSCITTGPALESIRANQDALLPQFSPLSGKKAVVSAWVKEDLDCNCAGYSGNQIGIVLQTPEGSVSTVAHPAGSIIEGWQRYEQVVDLPAGATRISVNLMSTGTSIVYFDDLRIHPYHANMKSFVYHPENLRLMAELDENNYATFYEYDDDGALIRLKKETIRGIKTLRETRNALLKEETP